MRRFSKKELREIAKEAVERWELDPSRAGGRDIFALEHAIRFTLEKWQNPDGGWRERFNGPRRLRDASLAPPPRGEGEG
jgi:hypothetical protein